MTYLLVLAALALLPIILIVVLKVNAAIAFLSLCLGSVLVTVASVDVTTFVAALTPQKTPVITQWVNLGLLTIPFGLSIIFTRRSVHGNKQLTNFLPAVASGLLYAILVIPLLSRALQQHLKSQTAWQQLSNLETTILIAGATFSLLFLLITHRGHRKAAEEKHSKH